MFIEPQNIVVDSGHLVAMNCSVAGSPVLDIQWMKDGRELSPNIHRIVNKTTLIVQKAQREDEGMYQCFVKNDYEVSSGSTQLLLGSNYHLPILLTTLI